MKSCDHCDQLLPLPDIGSRTTTLQYSEGPSEVITSYYCHTDTKDCYRLVTVYSHPNHCDCDGELVFTPDYLDSHALWH